MEDKGTEATQGGDQREPECDTPIFASPRWNRLFGESRLIFFLRVSNFQFKKFEFYIES